MFRKSFIFMVIFLVVASIGFAQEPSSPLNFIGFYYDNSLHGLVGSSLSLGANLYGLGYGQIGYSGGQLNSEILWLPISGRFWFGPLLGGDFVVENTPEEPSIERLVMATGAVAGYWFSETIGCWAGIKWASDFSSESSYDSKWTYGAGLTLDFVK